MKARVCRDGDNLHSGRAFTLIELLVVISIVSLVFAIVFPAVMSAREAARRAGCFNNLRQFGLSLANYHGTYGSFPPGRIKGYDVRVSGEGPPCTSLIADKSLHVNILPFVEQASLFNAVNSSVSILSVENTTIHSISLPLFCCPSDYLSSEIRDIPFEILEPYGSSSSSQTPPRMAFTSYSGCLGSLESLALPMPSNHCTISQVAILQNDGLFNDLSPLNDASVTDGLSNTILMSEKAISLNRDLELIRANWSTKFGWYVVGNWGDTLFSTTCPPNGYTRVSLKSWHAQVYSASSLHASGVNVLMSDGSVRFVTDSIQSWPIEPNTGFPVGIRKVNGSWWENIPRKGVWQALSSRNGGEIISEF